jgi:hypothetical protein
LWGRERGLGIRKREKRAREDRAEIRHNEKHGICRYGKVMWKP